MYVPFDACARAVGVRGAGQREECERWAHGGFMSDADQLSGGGVCRCTAALQAGSWLRASSCGVWVVWPPLEMIYVYRTLYPCIPDRYTHNVAMSGIQQCMSCGLTRVTIT